MIRSIIFLIFLGIFQSGIAQQNYIWDEYSIGFSLADEFREVTNNLEEFSAVGDGMEISIIPFKDASIDDSDISAYTMAI
ncbi:MAG: hypothetical protein WAU01_17595, partial [Saprospiraceae bacterium]